MTKKVRDNFTAQTVKFLRERVNNFCSNPDCRRLTSEPKQGGASGINLTGVAAHICAASSLGPRYDESMSTEARKDISNGIWLCNRCARLIDIEPNVYPTELLQQWKKSAELRVLKNSKISMFLGAYDLEYNLNISKDLAKNADFIFTHAKANIPQLNKMNIKTDKINVIHRGINIKELSLVIENINKKSNQIICAGRFLPDKGFDKVIDIFSKLNKNINNSNLVLVGYGSAQSDLEKQTIDLKIESNVTFTGYLSQNDVLKFMAESDIFLFLSSKAGERLPNVVKEAMLAGCICIVSNTPGIDELIEDGKTGFIVESNNYDLIPNLISSLDEIKKEEIRTNAKEFILKNFDVELSMKKYINIWESNE